MSKPTPRVGDLWMGHGGVVVSVTGVSHGWVDFYALNQISGDRIDAQRDRVAFMFHWRPRFIPGGKVYRVSGNHVGWRRA